MKIFGNLFLFIFPNHLWTSVEGRGEVKLREKRRGVGKGKREKGKGRVRGKGDEHT